MFGCSARAGVERAFSGGNPPVQSRRPRCRADHASRKTCTRKKRATVLFRHAGHLTIRMGVFQQRCRLAYSPDILPASDGGHMSPENRSPRENGGRSSPSPMRRPRRREEILLERHRNLGGTLPGNRTKSTSRRTPGTPSFSLGWVSIACTVTAWVSSARDGTRSQKGQGQVSTAH